MAKRSTRETNPGVTRCALGKQHGVDGFGEEQARHALDVAEHPPALRHHVREGGEAVVQQHDLGGGPGGAAARSHRHAQVRAGEREHVVDAVAGHRHRVAAGLECGHEDLLLAGADPPEHRVALQRVGHRRQFRLRHLALAPGGQGAGIDRVIGATDPQLPGDGAHRHRAVPGDHLDGDVLLGEVGQRAARLGAQPLHQQGGRLHLRPVRAGMAGLGDVGRVGPAEHQHAQAVRGLRFGLLAGRISGGQQHVGGPKDPAAAGRAGVREHRPAPLACRGERHRMDRPPPRLAVRGPG
jgi:hypothetical protein